MRDRLLGPTADIFKALAHPVRLGIVSFLGNEERCVCEVVKALAVSQPTASKHLAILHARGLITRRRDGARVLYRVYPGVHEVFVKAEEVAGSVRQSEAALWLGAEPSRAGR